MLPYHSQGLPYFFTCEHLWLLAKLRVNPTNLVAQRPLDPIHLDQSDTFFLQQQRTHVVEVFSCGAHFVESGNKMPSGPEQWIPESSPQILACFSGDELRKWAEKWPVSRGARRKREGSRRSGRSLSTYFVPSILSSILPDRPMKLLP